MTTEKISEFNTKHNKATDSSAAVTSFMRTSQHPHGALIEALRLIFLSLSSEVKEGVKWNAPSFRCKEYFATINLREKQGVGIILHLGAKIKALPKGGVQINDPLHLLTWLSNDRASLTLLDTDDFQTKKAALIAILQQWITYL